MDYFFQEQRWTGTFLSLHVKKFKRIILFLLIAFSAAGAKAQSDVKFNDYVRYSQWVIDSRLSDFYGNRKKFGFNTYDSNLNSKNTVSTWYKEDGTNYSIQVDYVAGLVAKATIEAADYYKKFPWSKPWFKSVEWYGNQCTVPTSPDNLDAINASKMYFGIYNLANDAFKNVAGKNEAGEETATYAQKQLGNALTALGNYNKEYKSDGTGGYAFPASATLNSQDIAGGWFHKKSYLYEMWLDGQYMGPATLAQLINGYSSYSSKKLTDNDWKLITKQFSIVWNMCWDDTEKLLYHAFCSEQRSSTWAADAEIWTRAKNVGTEWEGMSAAGHSAAFWGRAEGWYFLALVDVLEQMQIAGLNQSTNGNHSCYTTLKGYLDNLAAGIMARQHATGCWYQLIGKDGNYSASYYGGKTYSATSNYLESSCTAIFTAAYLKAIRLGLLDKTTYEETATKAYKGMIAQFMKQRTDGTVDLLGCCKSAGLGTSAVFGNDKFRDGSNAYYLLGKDVPPTSSSNSSDYYTEGKVLGAFIMAATEYERLYQPSTLLSKDLNSTYTLSSNDSLSVEVLGDGKPKYQWYYVTESTESAIDGATNASYTPTQSGKYYCKITVTPTSASAKTRDASTSGSYTIKTSIAEVYVAAAATTYTVTFNVGSNGTCSTTSLTQESAGATITLPEVTPKTGYKFDGWYTASEGGTKVTSPYKPESSNITLYAHYISTVSTSVVATFENPTKTTWNEKDQNGFTITGVSNIKSDGSAKLSSGGSITLNIPEGYTVTGFDFTLLCANTSEGSKLSVGDDEISVYDGTHTLHKMNLSSSVTGPTTLTITNSGGKELNIESIKVYGSNGKSISFTIQPQDAEYVKGAANVTALTVAAKVNNVTGTAPGISYHWFWNNTKSTDGGTAINDQESSTSCIPGVSTPGTKYYYCKATATVGEETLEAYSNIATVTVSNPTLTIVTQPVGATYAKDQTGVAKLMVVAETNSGEEIKYQWYSKNTESAEFSPINNATSSEYLPPVNQVGTKYYYCEVKSGSLTKNTETVTITVTNDQPTYVYKVDRAGLPAPAINSSKYITTTEDETGETGEKLVKMTFGGWRWNGGTYTKPEDKKDITDSWTASETQAAGVAALDGFNCWFRGTQDAKHEKKDSVSFMYGKNRYGWFVSPKRENGITTDSYPYTLPVRGSFMTFEPTKNGTLTIYILQNGVWNSDTKNNIDIIPGEFRMHAFQITNQRGLVLAEFAPTYSVTNNQKVKTGYSCSQYLTKPETFNNQSTDVSNWKEFWDLSEAERKAVHDSWSDTENNGCQKIIKLDNGSFLAIQKAVVKYQFHVTGNETYYFFSNFSKMGFSGATFQPDAAQPTDVTTFSGTNSLSDTKDYTEMTMTQNGTIGETGLTNYKYTINGEEVGKVDGVFIPQFKKITLNRTFKPNQWTTLSLPFNLTQTEVEQIFGEGTQIIVFDKAKITSARTYLTFFYHEIQNVLPGYPYLIRPTLVDADGKQMVTKSNSADNTPTYTITGGNLTEFTVYNKAINPHINQQEFKSGDYTAKCTPSYCTADEFYNNINYSKQYKKGDIFVSEGDGTVYISEGKSYGKGYRSYIDYTGTTPPSAKALSISFSGVEDGDDNGTTTEIRVTELADDVIQTLGIGGVYNLNGQKVADTTRNLPAGIYIVNGRKVVVK